MYKVLVILITTILLNRACCLDDVSESLTLRPLTNGDWLLTLDVSIISSDVTTFFENPEEPYFIMDVMPIDVAKLYFKTKSDWFEADLGFGEWKDTVWGRRPEFLITNGLSLLSSWPSLDKKWAFDQLTSLCYGLWGVTGSMFSNLVNDDSFVHDLTELYTTDYETKSKPSSTVLLSTDSEDMVCLDTLFKLRFLLPCVCTNGLVSILGDERLFSRSSYRGVKLRVEKVSNDLLFKTRVQFTVSKSMLPSTFSGFFPDDKMPKSCRSISKSVVKFVFPNHSQFSNVTFDYSDEVFRQELMDKYSELVTKFPNGYQLEEQLPDLVFEVSELESRYLRVLKRVQSSLLIRVENNSQEVKKFCVHQPLPYWLHPLLHSITVVVEDFKNNDVIYKCASADCFSRNAKNNRNYNSFLDILNQLLPSKYFKLVQKLFDFLNPVPRLENSPNDPLMIYELGSKWNNLGIYTSLDPNTVMFFSVELSKDNITYEDIHLSAHRGQLIPSGVLLDLATLNSCLNSNQPNFDTLSSYSCNNFYYFMTSFFSHIVLPDNSKFITILIFSAMVFNVMALVGVVTAFLFGFVFNTFTRDWDKTFKV